MAKASDQTSQFSPEYIIYHRSQACKLRFKECFHISGLNYDDWLEQRCAEFNWWTTSLNADKQGPESLDVQLRLRPDVMDDVSIALNSLESSLSNYYSIQHDSQKTHIHASSGYDVYHKPRIDIKNNLKILTRIHIKIQHSGLKFKYQRADDALKQAEEAYNRQKTDLGERSAPEGQNGDHERFRRHLAKVILGNRYLQGPASLNKVQHRLINANIVRRNRLIYAGSVPKLLSQPATIVDPGFEITGELAPPSMSKSPTTKISAREEYLDYPKCPVDQGQFPCPYCPTILPGEYAARDKWRKHVAQDLCVYVCIFEDCNSPDDMFASTYEWMSHMARFHSAVEWVCPECVMHSDSSVQNAAGFSFESSALLKRHMLDSHPALDPVELDFLVETGKRTLGIRRVQCPLCRVCSVTLEDSGEDGTDGMASLSSIGQDVGLIQLEEDEHIATHIHEFALESLPSIQEPTLENSQVSVSHSSLWSSFHINFRYLEDLPPSSTNQPSMYKLDDVEHMLDDLRDYIRGLLSIQGLFNQSPTRICNSPCIDNAKFSRNRSLLSKRLDDIAHGNKILQPRIRSLGSKDINAFAKSLNECRATISQFSDLTVDDIIEKSLHIQLLRNLKHSNKILQQAFTSSLDELMEQGSDKFSPIETENFQHEKIKINRDESEEIESLELIHEDISEETDTETDTKIETEYLGAEEDGTALSELELEIEEDQFSKIQPEEAQNEEVVYEEFEDEGIEDEDIEDEEEQREEIQTEESQTKDVQTEEDQTESREFQPDEDQTRNNPAEETQTKNPLTHDAPANDAKPEEYEAMVSKIRGVNPNEQEQKNAKWVEPESEFASDKAKVPTTESSTTKSTEGLLATKPSVTKWNGQEADVVDSGVEYPDLKASGHTEKKIVDKGKGLVTTDTLISNEPRFNTPQDIQEDMTGFIRDAGLGSFFPKGSTYILTVAHNAFEFKNNEDNLLNRDVDIQGITRLNLFQLVLYCDDSTSMKASSRVRGQKDRTRVDDQKDMVRRVTRIFTSLVPPGHGTSLQFINHVRDLHDNKLSQRQVKDIMNSVKPTGHTKIGTNLKKKILQPLIYDVINKKEQIERPILVSCITDGCPSHEPVDQFKETILECIRILKENGYPPSTIKFQISQIGNSSSAGKYLKQLQHDDDLKGVVYCTAQRIDEQFEEFRHNELMLERWLLRTLLEPIMGQAINSLNL